MKKEVMVGSVIILLLCMSSISLGADLVGKSSCVTYEQARAQGVKGTDAELQRMGFCSGTAAQPTTTATDTPSDLSSLKADYEQQKAVAEKAHQEWLDCLDCYVQGGDGCPMCVPLEEKDNEEAKRLSDLEDALDDVEAAASQEMRATPVPEQVNVDLSGKSLQELADVRNRIYNSLLEVDAWEEYNRVSVFSDRMGQSAELRMKYLDESYKKYNACSDPCSNLKFQRGGTGQECLQKCNDMAEADNKRFQQEIDQFERETYTDDIAKIQSILKGSSITVSEGEKKPAGPGWDTDDDKGRTLAGSIAPSLDQNYLGYAYVERPDGTKVIPGKELYLKVDDKVVTGAESKVNIMFGNAGRMNLGPNTELRVGTALLDQYYLAKGTLKTKLDWTAGAKLRIDTMNAAIFTKGTEFVTEYNETSNTTTVYLYEGTLEIETETETLLLSAGNYCTVGPDGKISTYSMQTDDWIGLGERFYEPSVSEVDITMKIYLWLSFIVMLASNIVSRIIVKRSSRKDNKKNLGVKSIVFGAFGLVTSLFPFIGYPLSITSLAMGRLQKIRKATISARIGAFVGLTGVILNGLVFLLVLIGVLAA